MPKEFEPYNQPIKNAEFSAWDYNVSPPVEQQAEVNEEEAMKQEYERLQREAYSIGYAEGLEKAQAEMNLKKSLFIQWFSLLKNPIKLIDEELSQELIQTLIWVCEHCIGVELSVHPEKISAVLDEIKKELPSLKGNKKLSMHPDDIQWIKSELDEKTIPGLFDFLCEDPTLNRGDFYLKGDHAELDGRIHSRLITLFRQYINKDNLITPMKTKD